MYELAYRFWRAAEEQSFTPSETALYFLLLNRANMYRWEMPVRCPTITACMLMGTSKQNLLKARTGLVERGLIAYARSNTRGRCGQYTLLPFGQFQLPDELPVRLSDGLTNELPAYNNKDKENKTSNNNAREEIKSIEELETEFCSDELWLTQVISLVSSPNIRSCDDVKAFLHRFFDTMRVRKVKEREEKDCREHFINWLMINLRKHTAQVRNDKHRPECKNKSGMDRGTALGASAYYEPF
ncbi:MAG: hypothetical protein K2O88_05210 [Paramuribaculum sp.]|nr:hypothetical protein [Paramuribaculum sp.]